MDQLKYSTPVSEKKKNRTQFRKQTQSYRIPRNISKDSSEISPSSKKKTSPAPETISNLWGGAEQSSAREKSGGERKQKSKRCVKTPCSRITVSKRHVNPEFRTPGDSSQGGH
ncbi:hypothetical protein CEXT_197461 [Caerostris extrusa]|uniref:Uncharacterized protein n=1 Tax=Caerostris extrusa TaxID=172846 RepID=A0AAV4X594_CAEEX|nr:hypothetical protein CEXT_197461 [Caerostris extrusa]